MTFERNPNFTGRESQLAQLEEKLFRGRQATKFAVTGLGGVGKTQLVLELASTELETSVRIAQLSGYLRPTWKVFIKHI